MPLDSLPVARLAESPPLQPIFVATVIPIAEPVERVEPMSEFDPLSIPRRIHAAAVWALGIFGLAGSLAILAAIPIVQFLTLGYLIECGARVARTGRLRNGFVGVRKAARITGLVLGCWLFMLPVRLVADFAYSAAIIGPGTSAAVGWRWGLLVLLTMVGLHIVLAVACGGALWRFFWPFNFVTLFIRLWNGRYYQIARDAVWDFTVSLRLPYYFWLGFRAFVVGLIWLVIPISIMALGRVNVAIAPFVGFFGALLLILILPYVPFLQMQMARDNRLSSGFKWLAVRRTYRCSPFLHAFAFVMTLLLAVPLYLFKIETVPSEAEWLPSLIFVIFMAPAKILVGWAMGRAGRRGRASHWTLRWSARFVFLPAATAYVIFIFFSQYTSWNGIWSLYEQHAFLLPVPFANR